MPLSLTDVTTLTIFLLRLNLLDNDARARPRNKSPLYRPMSGEFCYNGLAVQSLFRLIELNRYANKVSKMA